jgi:DNA-binding response OmpR family regulator
MARILLVDDDPGTVDTMGRVLRLAHHDFVGAMTAADGIRIAATFDPDIAAVDLHLPDASGFDVVRRLAFDLPRVACMIITGYWSREAMQEGIRAGVCDWLDKPVFAEELLRAIKRVLVGRGRHVVPEPHAATRLAAATVKFLESKSDALKLECLGREVNHSGGCLRNWCATANILPKHFRDFTRALRAVHLLVANPHWLEAHVLDTVDHRTIEKFRIKCGGTSDRLPETVEIFLEKQTLVPNRDFVTAVQTQLSRGR